MRSLLWKIALMPAFLLLTMLACGTSAGDSNGGNDEPPPAHPSSTPAPSNTPVPTDTLEPTVVPTSKGSVQLEWHEHGIDLEVEILSPYRIHVSFEDELDSKNNWERELKSDLTRLSNAILVFTRRGSSG